MNIYNELAWRELIYDSTNGTEAYLAQNTGLEEKTGDGKQVTLYIGFDPTAKSLHVGSFLQIMALARMQRAGHRPIGLVGGGTGMIGDPSGKTAERQLLTRDKLEENKAGIREQLARFLDFDAKDNAALLVDNGDWLGSVGLIDFLRDIGKHFTVNQMVARDSVRSRMDSEHGISFTEFSYQLLQSYDFLVLHDRYGCTLQMGASDQWGNIVSGADLVRKLRQKRVHGLVSPLVTTSAGVKFGKTEAGAVWLDAELTSPYEFYQFWLNTADADVVRYLKYFTWLDQQRIAELASTHQQSPQAREAHAVLAAELTRMVHGETALDLALRSSQVLFGGSLDDLPAASILAIFEDVPSTRLERGRFDGGMALVDLLVESGVTPSKSQARRLVRDGGAYVNNQRFADEQASISVDDFKDGQVLVLRKGRKSYHVIQLLGASEETA